MNKLDLKSVHESSKRYYTVIAYKYMKGRRIKLRPNERALLGLIVHNSQHEGGNIRISNNLICEVFGWAPSQLIRAAKSLVEKGLITRDASDAVHDQQGTEYSLLLPRKQAEQQQAKAIEQELPFQPVVPQNAAEPQDDKEMTRLKEECKRLKVQNQRLGKSLWSLRERVEVIEQDLQGLNKKMELLANTLISRSIKELTI